MFFSLLIVFSEYYSTSAATWKKQASKIGRIA